MTYGQIWGSEQAGNCVLQSSLAIAQEIDARGVAKSAKNVFHYNTQKLLGEKFDAANLPRKVFRCNARRCSNNNIVWKYDAKQCNIDLQNITLNVSNKQFKECS